MVSHWSLSDSKLPQIFGRLFSILAKLNYPQIWMFFTCPIFKSSSPLFKRLGMIPIVPITIGLTVSHLFHRFFLDF